MHGEMHGRMHRMGIEQENMGMRGRGMFGGLRSLVLNLLYENPLRGSEIMEAIGQRTMGWWTPSPGSIYPLLSRLEADGYTRRMQDGKYELTEKGKDEVAVRRNVMRNFSPFARPTSVDEMITEIDAYVTYFSDLGKDMEPYRERISSLAERLRKISENL